MTNPFEQSKLGEELRRLVWLSLPEFALIEDVELRDKCVDAWVLALSETEFSSIDEIRGSGKWNSTHVLTDGQSQAIHIRAVTRMAVAMAEALEEVVGPLGIDFDLLVAAGLCHDIGKPFEFSPRNQRRWSSTPHEAGWPSVRHPVYGAHIALKAGLPESLVNAIGGHSMEGELIQRSLETTCIHFADYGFWAVMKAANKMEPAKPSDDSV